MMNLSNITESDGEVIKSYCDDYENTSWFREPNRNVLISKVLANLESSHLIAVGAIDKMIRSADNG